MDTKEEIQNIFIKNEKICLYGVLISTSIWVSIAVILKINGATQEMIDMWVMPGVIAVGFSACVLNNVLLRNSVMNKLKTKKGVEG